MTSNQNTNWHPHTSVLLQPSVDHMVVDTDGVYIDATLGGAGHSAYLLSILSENATVFGIDQDDQALAAAQSRVGEDKRFHPIKGNFSFMSTLIAPEYHGKVNGILLDLGVSMHQLKAAERGFSHKEDGPLDMRMGNLTMNNAAVVCNEYDEQRLADLIYRYGEERLSRKIAKGIVESRPLRTTADLRDVVKRVVKGAMVHKSLARVFQAIRIEVNQELRVLEDVLEQSLQLLAPEGRLSIISYHSLEDRLVKRFLKSGNVEGKVEKDLFGNTVSLIEPLFNKVITPDEAEIASNPAARSAKLRVGVMKEGEN